MHACDSTRMTSFYSAFLNIHQRGVLTVLTWLVPHEAAAYSLCSVYTIQPCTMQSHIHKVHACLAVTCHLHFWQNGWDLLHATVVTWGWNGYPNKSQYGKLTLMKEHFPAAPVQTQTHDLSIMSLAL